MNRNWTGSQNTSRQFDFKTVSILSLVSLVLLTHSSCSWQKERKENFGLNTMAQPGLGAHVQPRDATNSGPCFLAVSQMAFWWGPGGLWCLGHLCPWGQGYAVINWSQSTWRQLCWAHAISWEPPVSNHRWPVSLSYWAGSRYPNPPDECSRLGLWCLVPQWAEKRISPRAGTKVRATCSYPAPPFLGTQVWRQQSRIQKQEMIPSAVLQASSATDRLGTSQVSNIRRWSTGWTVRAAEDEACVVFAGKLCKLPVLSEKGSPSVVVWG